MGEKTIFTKPVDDLKFDLDGMNWIEIANKVAKEYLGIDHISSNRSHSANHRKAISSNNGFVFDGEEKTYMIYQNLNGAKREFELRLIQLE